MIKDIVLCGECKYKPYLQKYLIKMDGDKYNFVVENIESLPSSPCPCIHSDDIRYKWIPENDWYCGNGEPK